jgi:hypothetical protein
LKEADTEGAPKPIQTLLVAYFYGIFNSVKHILIMPISLDLHEGDDKAITDFNN